MVCHSFYQTSFGLKSQGHMTKELQKSEQKVKTGDIKIQ